MKFYENMLSWSWRKRLLIAGGLFLVSFLFLLQNRIWIWGWVAGAMVIVTPVLFGGDKSVFDVEIEEIPFDESEVELSLEEIEPYLLKLSSRLDLGFDKERALKLANILVSLQSNQLKTMEYNVRSQEKSVPLRIHAKVGDNGQILLKIETQEPVTALVLSN